MTTYNVYDDDLKLISTFDADDIDEAVEIAFHTLRIADDSEIDYDDDDHCCITLPDDRLFQLCEEGTNPVPHDILFG